MKGTENAALKTQILSVKIVFPYQPSFPTVSADLNKHLLSFD